jgi:U3 small nucleolar RNA-associated protein 25
VFIENKEEERIGEFRQEFVEHVLKHLQLCGNSQKSKGFTNPKILILTPFMGDARAIIDLIAAKVNLPEENRERVDEIDDETDMFRISMTISQRNKKLKYFANFNHAHVIISSPLGLRTIVGAEGD